MLLGALASADEAPNPLTDRFQVTLGTFFVATRPIVQLNGDSGSGDAIDWDREFGGVDARRIRLDGYWRFSPRHKIRVMAFDLSHDHSEVLDEDIHWGDDTFPLNAQVNARFRFAIFEAAYEYALLRRDTYELEASLGLHYTTLKASLEAHAESSGGTLTEDLNDSARLDAPLPVIGLSGTWSLSHGFWLDASAQFFVLSIDDYDGNLQSYRASLTWQPKAWLGIGVGYSQFSINVDVDTGAWEGALDWTYRGPMIFYRASF